MSTKVTIRGFILPGNMPEIAEMINSDYYTNWLFAPFYTAKLKRLKAKGKLSEPVHIVGHSLGGNATLRMANDLGDAGIEVGTVIMLDPTYEQRLKYGKSKWAVLSGDFRAKPISGATTLIYKDLNHMNLIRDPRVLDLIKKEMK